MSKSFSITATLLITFFVNPADACRTVRPDPNKLDRFETIFLGEVTGVRLVGREHELLGRPDGCMLGSDGKTDECFSFIGGSKPVTLYSVPITVVKGKAEKVQELQMVGCSGVHPNLNEKVLFFVNAGDHSAITILESNGKEYDEWLKRLGIAK